MEGGKATITATHAATGMKDTISVTAHTLQDQFYLFQVTPAVETTLRYTNGDKEERNVTTNSEGVLALYEPAASPATCGSTLRSLRVTRPRSTWAPSTITTSSPARETPENFNSTP